MLQETFLTTIKQEQKAQIVKRTSYVAQLITTGDLQKLNYPL